MKIGIVGATGKVGKLILKESQVRGHEITALVRDASKLEEDVRTVEKDVLDLKTEDFEGLDVVVNAFGAGLGEEEPHVTAGRALIEALEGTDIRLIVVGGAGSLYTDDSKSVKVADTPDFPDAFKPTAAGQARNLEDLTQTANLKWTFISPSAQFDAEGARTGSYEKGGDVLLVNNMGNSYISYPDYAIAVLDEVENAEHVKSRFTVVGEEA